MNHKEIIEVANKLTNENIEQLINIFSDRIFVFIGSNNKMQLSDCYNYLLAIMLLLEKKKERK